MSSLDIVLDLITTREKFGVRGSRALAPGSTVDQSVSMNLRRCVSELKFSHSSPELVIEWLTVLPVIPIMDRPLNRSYDSDLAYPCRITNIFWFCDYDSGDGGTT